MHSSTISISTFQSFDSSCGFTTPLSLYWFLSIDGAEYCHAYFWILKDLAWMQGWTKLSFSMGISALAWSMLILYHALNVMNYHELWNFVALFLWLFANFWWMIGEDHDYELPDEPPVTTQHTNASAIILSIALIWVLLYYTIILPCKLFPSDYITTRYYDDGKMKSRIPCLKLFRQYENLHMLFWIGKDLAWSQNLLIFWIICLLPTFIIAFDHFYISFTQLIKDTTISAVHFFVVFLWVVGDSVWAIGDFFTPDYNSPQHIWTSSSVAFHTARWYSSWILFLSLILIIVLYIVWMYVTFTGRLRKNILNSRSDDFEQEDLLITHIENPPLSMSDDNCTSNDPTKGLDGEYTFSDTDGLTSIIDIETHEQEDFKKFDVFDIEKESPDDRTPFVQDQDNNKLSLQKDIVTNVFILIERWNSLWDPDQYDNNQSEHDIAIDINQRDETKS